MSPFGVRKSINISEKISFLLSLTTTHYTLNMHIVNGHPKHAQGWEKNAACKNLMSTPRIFVFIQEIIDFDVANAPPWMIFFLGSWNDDVIALKPRSRSKWGSQKMVGAVTAPSDNDFPLVVHMSTVLSQDDSAAGIAYRAYRQ